MGIEIIEPNTCIRGCCHSSSIPLHLPPSSFSLSSPIARGAESIVYEGNLDGRRVAVKKPILSTSEDIDKFHKELQLLCKLDHPGLEKLIAAHAKPPNYMFFFDLYESGNLAHKLHVEEWFPSIHQSLAIILQLAEALQYLHGLGILHRDVKPANILLGENFFPHLADFGLAEYGKDLKKASADNWKSSKPTGGFHKKNMVGTTIYMAPEILKRDIHTEKSDVYSFAVSVNELLTGVVPYTDLRAEAEAHTVLEMNYTEQKLIAAVVSEGLRPILVGSESGAPLSLLALIKRCWDADPGNRPSFTYIVSELNSICEEVRSIEIARNSFVECTDSAQQSMEQSCSFQIHGEDINWFSEGEEISNRISLDVAPGTTFGFDCPNDMSSYNPILSCGSFATCGAREAMEDIHFLLPQMGDKRYIHLFGIFDGHRGSAAAEFSARALPKLLQSLSSDFSPAESLARAFVEVDVSFRSVLDSHRKSKSLMKKDWHPGCTAITALLVRNKLYVANAGDCRAILSRSGHAIAVSRDHVASCLEERNRILKAGGQVRWRVDTWRVGEAALQVTRSIGDDDLKPAVTAEPEITETSLSSDDEYMVMASDGLWDVMSNEEVVSIIRDTVKEANMCSKRLATEAAQRGSKDNITVIVVFLRPVTTAERIY